MGRWSHLDTDKERLPEGMTRIGYDADTQTYTFRDGEGNLWKGAPGCQYGKLFRVKPPSPLGSVTVEEPEGDEPDAILNEGPWEPPAGDAPMRKDSMVRKFIKRLGSVRKARSHSTATNDLDEFLHGEPEDIQAGGEKDARDAKEKPADSVTTPTKDEKEEVEQRERSLSSSSVFFEKSTAN